MSLVQRGTGDWNVKYRPCTFSELKGIPEITRMIASAIAHGALPHAMLFTGPPGCGKTTMARLIALSLNCFEVNARSKPTDTPQKIALRSASSFDNENIRYANPCCICDSCKAILNLNSFSFIELDGARSGLVDVVRGVLEDLPAASMGGENHKIAIFDEAHQLSGKAEDALLKFLEDTPKHVYIILCTNEPHKLKEVTRSRCKIFQFNRVSVPILVDMLTEVCEFEGIDYRSNNNVLTLIAEESNGSPRTALSYLQQISMEGSWSKDVVSLIVNAGASVDQMEVFEFCKVLIKGNWVETKKAYEKIKHIPAESSRITILGFLTACARNANTMARSFAFADMAEQMLYVYYIAKPEHALFTKICQVQKIIAKLNSMERDR